MRRISCTKRLALAGEKTSHAAMTMMSAKPAMKWTETSRRCGRRLARAADPSAMPEAASAPADEVEEVDDLVGGMEALDRGVPDERLHKGTPVRVVPRSALKAE